MFSSIKSVAKNMRGRIKNAFCSQNQKNIIFCRKKRKQEIKFESVSSSRDDYRHPRSPVRIKGLSINVNRTF